MARARIALRAGAAFKARARDGLRAGTGPGTGTGPAVQAWRDVDLRGIQLDESSTDGKPRSWIMVAPIGTFQHERYGTLNFTRAKLAEMARNFDRRVRHIDIALDVDHDQGAATGWLERLAFRDGSSDGDGAGGDTPAGLWALVRWTPHGAQLLKDEIYRYFSPEFGDWKDPASGTVYHNVLMGGALTNRPFLKTMPPVQLSERQRVERGVRLALWRLYEATGKAVQLADGSGISTTSWASVNKAQLPAACFLIVGDPHKKATWHLPVYEGAGAIGAGGMYTKRGPLNIHAVRAAIDAIGGARTGTPMSGVSAAVKARLERWIQQYGGGKGTAAATGKDRKAASEGERVNRKTTNKRTAGAGTGKVLSEQEKREAMLRQLAEEAERENAEMDDGDESFIALDEASDEGDDEDEDGDETVELDEASDDREAYTDPDDDGDDDLGGFDSASDTHGPMTTDGHTHGKFAEHSHDDDGDHSEAPLKKGRKMASEGGNTGRQSSRRSAAGHTHSHGREGDEQPMTLAEMRAEVKRLREENARNSYKLYETEVEKTLAGWKSQTFQFKEGTGKGGKAVVKSGRIALSRAFSEQYRRFMLRGAAIRLSERDRGELNALVECALSSAVVDLTARGTSYDQEARRTIRAGGKPGGPSDSDELEAEAQRLALSEEHTDLAELEPAKQMRFYERAAKKVGYH